MYIGMHMYVCVVAVWCGGCVVWWLCGVVVVWCGGCVVWWLCGVVVVWCGGCVVWWLCVWWMCGVVVVSLTQGIRSQSSSPTQAIFHLIYHLPPTCPTSPPSCD